MHELAIARSLIDLASRHAAAAGAGRVFRLRCRIGAMRQIDDAFMQGAFEAARVGTACADAELLIDKPPMQARCQACHKIFVVRDWHWTCPSCSGEGELLEGGDELELVSIDAGG